MCPQPWAPASQRAPTCARAPHLQTKRRHRIWSLGSGLLNGQPGATGWEEARAVSESAPRAWTVTSETHDPSLGTTGVLPHVTLHGPDTLLPVCTCASSWERPIHAAPTPILFSAHTLPGVCPAREGRGGLQTRQGFLEAPPRPALREQLGRELSTDLSSAIPGPTFSQSRRSKIHHKVNSHETTIQVKKQGTTKGSRSPPSPSQGPPPSPNPSQR